MLRVKYWKRKFKTWVTYAAIAAMLMSSAPARGLAASTNWTGTAGDGNWNNAANWSNGVPGAADSAFFNGASTGTTTINVASASAFTNLLFDTTGGGLGSFTIGGNSLALSSGGTISINNLGSFSGTETINNNLSLAGNYTFANNNSGGSLVFGGGISTTATTGTSTLALGGIGVGSISGLISDGGAGGLVALNVTGDGTWTLGNAANSYSGGTTINGGTLAISAAGDLGTGSLTINNNATLAFAPTSFSGTTTPSMVYTPGITLGGTGVLGGTFDVALGAVETLSGVITGSSLTKTDFGSLVLTNSNALTGLINVDGGSLVVTSAAALGAAGSATNSTAYSIAVNGAATAGFPNTGGGTLVLAGGQATSQNITLTSNIYFSGDGNSAINGVIDGSSLTSIGNNALTGTITLATDGSLGGTTANGIASSFGNLTLGTAGSNVYIENASTTQIDQWLTGNGNITIAGNITGNARLRANTHGTVILSGNNSGTWGTGATTGGGGIIAQSGFVQLSSAANLGAPMSNNENLFFDAGTVAIRSDPNGSSLANPSGTLSAGAVGSVTDVGGFSTTGEYLGFAGTSPLFLDRAVGGSGLNGTVQFTNFTWIANTSLSVSGLDGYGVSIGTLGNTFDVSGTSAVSITNTSSGLVNINESMRFGQSTTNRILTVAASGDVTIQGNLLSNTGAATFLGAMTKTGTGTLTVAGLGGGSDPPAGAVNVNVGTLAINAFEGLNTDVLNLGVPSGTTITAGALNFLGIPAGGGITNGETTTTMINLASTTGNGILLANQNGSALTLAGPITTGGVGAKILYLGGSSTAANTIQGVIQDSTGGATSLTKIGTGTWILAPQSSFYNSNGPTGVTATANTASTFMVPVSSTTNIFLGEPVSGAGIPNGSVVVAINPLGTTNTIQLSEPIGAVASGVDPVTPGEALTFGAAVSNFTGNVIISGGTLGLQATTTTSNIINDTSTITFNADPLTGSGIAGGTLQYQGNSGGSSELVGQLIPTAGANAVQVTGGVGGSGGGSMLTFASLGTRTAGATLDFQPGSGIISFTAAPTATNGVIIGSTTIAYATINGTNYATYSGGMVAPPTYGATGSFITGLPASGSVAATNYFLTGSQTTTALESVNTLKLTASGTSTLTLFNGIMTLTEQSVLFDNSNGAYTIAAAGSASQLGAAAKETVIITNGSGPSNALTINTLIGSTTGALTKSGTGTLIVGGNNTYTGNTVINQGTVQLAGATATLGVPGAANLMSLRQGATLDLNGAGSGGVVKVGGLSGAGTITNSGGALGTTASTLQIGSTTAASAVGTFTGIIQNGGTLGSGVLNVTKDTTGTEVFAGLNTYTGVTTLNAGTLSVTSLAIGGVASGIGASSSAASNLVFNGGILQYEGNQATYETPTATPSVSTDRQFTLAGNGTLDSSGSYGNVLATTAVANNAALVFSSTAPVTFSGATSKTLTLQGNSIADNQLAAQLPDNPLGGTLSVTKAGAGTWILSNNNTYSGTTTITLGQLNAVDGAGLPSTSNLNIVGGVLESTGTFVRTLGTGAGQVQFTGITTALGGFSASTAPLVVAIGGMSTPTTLEWGFTPNFLGSGVALALNSVSALSEVQLVNSLNLNATAQTITVADNTSTTTDFATLLGAIINGPSSGTALTKGGAGTLDLASTQSSYTGNTLVNGGTLVVSSIGGSSSLANEPSTSSLGASNVSAASLGA
ncbi:MAG TPA: autotransporter-associated beta strand repeat-containing protein, partial [Pirellulales bacterium]|nr:autotransporter-associated beta strand repeat-containing protein [Pirellulales bacterium]